MNKLAYPRSSIQLTFKVEGVFGTPDDWKTTDDANPGLFAYTARCLAFEMEKGKVFARELTAREVR